MLQRRSYALYMHVQLVHKATMHPVVGIGRALVAGIQQVMRMCSHAGPSAGTLLVVLTFIHWVLFIVLAVPPILHPSARVRSHFASQRGVFIIKSEL